MLNTFSIYWDLFAVDTSSIPLDLSRICSWYLLDLSRCVFYIYIYIYISEVQHGFAQTQISQSLSLFSLNLNHFFSLKTFSHSSFQPNPSLNPLVSVLNLFSLSFFMHFKHLDPGFQVLGKFLGFWVICKNFGLGVLICSHMLMNCIL